MSIAHHKLGILDDWATEEELAKEFERCTRTIDRWTKEPDGLPYAKTGKTKRFHIPTAKEWMFGRMRRPNPRRAAAAAAVSHVKKGKPLDS